MKKFKIIPTIAASIILAASVQVSAQEDTRNQHYMMHAGDGPQGHNMEGREHQGPQTNTHQPPAAHRETAVGQNKHYMMHAGDGPQGHTMEGNQHTEGVSQTHTPQYGATSSKRGWHYMMLNGDSQQGYWMRGNSHPKG